MNQTYIPKQWHEVSLSDINNYQSKSVQPKNFLDETFELWSVPNFPTGKPEILSGQEIGSSKQAVAPQDVLICKINPRINRVWEVREVSEYRKIASSEWIVFRQPMVEPRFFRRFFQSSQFRDKLCADVSGVGGSLTRAQPKKVATFSVPVPPLAEQKVIADKLDTLLAQVDNTKARLERIPEILKRFRQSVLAAAVSGRLTEEWRKANVSTSVDQTLDEIASERLLKVKGKTKTPQPHLTKEVSPIPNTWKWVSLDSLSKKIVDGTHHTPTYVDQGIPFISVKDIKGGKISFNKTKFISESEHDELTKRCSVKKGDLLITKSGTIGRTAMVDTDRPFSIFVSVALIKPASPLVNLKYIDLALQKWVNEIDVSSRIVGSAIKNLHLRDMRVLAIPFAPWEEQTEIIRRVDQLFAHANRIEQQVNQALARVNNLTQSILAKAFRGELTEQWRKDNPGLISGENSAEALLERIKAERAAKAPAKRRKRNA